MDEPITPLTETPEPAPADSAPAETAQAESPAAQPDATPEPTETPETAAAETSAAQPESEKSEEKKSEDDEETYTGKQFLIDVLDIAESVVTAAFVVMMVFRFLFCTANVDGDSMLPTLENGDRLVVSRLDHSFETGDILIVNSDKAYTFDASGNLTAGPGLEKEIVKRLIAQGGQEVYINFDSGIVYVDGNALDEPYTSTLTTRDNRAFTYPFTVPEGYVFVLGDNRYISRDSRDPGVGLIPEENIIGNVLFRISPLSKFGKVE